MGRRIDDPSHPPGFTFAQKHRFSTNFAYFGGFYAVFIGSALLQADPAGFVRGNPIVARTPVAHGDGKKLILRASAGKRRHSRGTSPGRSPEWANTPLDANSTDTSPASGMTRANLLDAPRSGVVRWPESGPVRPCLIVFSLNWISFNKEPRREWRVGVTGPVERR